MGFAELPKEIQSHLRGLASEVQGSDNDSTLEALAGIWDGKRKLFADQARNLDLELVDRIGEDDPRGILALTYSGSLLALGVATDPEAGDLARWLEYSSIYLRTDVPKIIANSAALLAAPIEKGKPIQLGAASLQQTSAIYLLAVCHERVPLKEQDKRIQEAMIYLTNGFMKLNRSIQIDKKSAPEQFTMKSMSRYIAKKNNITGVAAKKLLDDFMILIETGMLLGEKVPLGRIGRLSIKKREPQKARVVRHPGTGEEITVKAKPAVGVPKISFSKYLKDKAIVIDFDDFEGYSDDE